VIPGTTNPRHNSLGLDRIMVRLTVLGVLIAVCFLVLFSRLWFLQVLASEQWTRLAQENRVRTVYSEPTRGRILDRNGKVLVTSRQSRSVTIDRTVLRDPDEVKRVLRALSKLLGVKVADMRDRLTDQAVSPYKPVAVANDVTTSQATYILENQEDFPGVGIDVLPIREYPNGKTAAHILGYTGEISSEELKSDFFANVRPRYQPGDIVGKSGVERTYDRFLRGRPEVRQVIVNSSNDPIEARLVQEEEEGRDLILSLDIEIQRLAENALEAGIMAARGAGYQAPAGGVVVMDPNDGAVLAMASYPTYDPSILADGITNKEWNRLGHDTPDDPDDDALLNRAIQAQRAPGSTFKVVTAGAALATGIADISRQIDCPPSRVYPPEGGPGSQVFNNWTSTHYGSIGFAESLEVSCDTFYYELGWEMEQRFGKREEFQRYARRAGLGHETGIDLPNEADGRIPDRAWCDAVREQTSFYLDDGDPDTLPTCYYGWLPGFSVNMSIGQGDVLATPIQMAVTYAAIANGGKVLQPRLGWRLGEPDETTGAERVVREFKAKTVTRLPLDAAEIEVLQQGLIDVISGDQGTAAGAFAGFPLERFPLAGKTGTAELGETDFNDAWFVSYGPADSPRYVIAVYVERAGHGGETAAPIARQIWEGIAGLDQDTEVRLGVDASG
jgi:penicillin-binding protein 2